MPVCDECMASPVPHDADYFCAVCHAPFLNDFPLDEHGVCAACRSGLQGFDYAASFGMYEGALRDLIHLYKYSGMRPLAKPLAGYLQRAIPVDVPFDAVVAVPLYWRKQWSRGFNQSELLARLVSDHRRIPLLHALRRKRATATQAGLASAGRRRNVTGAFELRKRPQVAGKRILLIDDVMTTGATASACAAVLKRGGATSVSLFTVARVDRRIRP